jgi:hypothetical protein
VPPGLIALGVAGTILPALDVLGAVGVNIGLPVLAWIQEFPVVLGLPLMAPLLFWVIRNATTGRPPRG